MTQQKRKIAYFGHNVNDAAVRRRIVALQQSGCDVFGFMHRRGPSLESGADVVDLGETADNAYVQRVQAVFFKRAYRERRPCTQTG